ncbi:MAG TPA: hypothetical protein VGM34_04175 [Chlamydiales bacterium]
MIEIRDKFRPFSHLPGTHCVIPGSDYVVQVFPTLIKVQGGGEFLTHLTGPVEEFTVQLDLERDCVFVWGRAKEGYFRLRLEALEEGLVLTVLRGSALQLKTKEKLVLATGGSLLSRKPAERLSLGGFKAQDWELIRRRANLAEISPTLFLLGQKIPRVSAVSIPDLKSCFLSSFSSLFFPHLIDPFHQGIATAEASDPLEILPACYQKIRSFLIDEMRILPALPHDWHAGRALRLETAVGSIDLEWTKGMIRRMAFRPTTEKPVEFTFPKQVRSFRTTVKDGVTLFDRFQK